MMKFKLKAMIALLLCLMIGVSITACGDSGDGGDDGGDDGGLTKINFDLDYELSEDASYYIVTGYGVNYATEITIPEKHEGLSVREISESAFNGKTQITKVIIPDTLTKIGDSAFENCTALKTVEIGTGLRDIGEYAFRGCSALTDITLPNGLKTIGKQAFSSCSSLQSINIPDTVVSVGHNVFLASKYFQGDYGTNLGGVYFVGKWIVHVDRNVTDANLPDNAIGIADGAFSRVSGLVSVEIPQNIKYIGTDAFAVCDNLESVTHVGTAETWAQISIGSGNQNLTEATRIYQ